VSDPLGRTPRERLEHYYFGSVPPHALGAFRILWGVYFLIAWAWKLPHVALYYSSEGMAFPFFPAPVGMPGTLDEVTGWLSQAPAPAVALSVYLFSGLVIILFLVGLRARAALSVHAVLLVYYYFLQMHTTESSYDRALFIITVLLAMSRCDEVFSLEATRRARRGEAARDSIPGWPQRLITFQIAFIYLGTGIYKLTTPDWSSGAILVDALESDWSTAVGFWFVSSSLPNAAFDLLVLQTILMEVWAPFLLFHPVLRKLFFLWGVSFHVGIAVMLNIPPFLFMVLSYVLFADPDWVRRYSLRAHSLVIRFRPAGRQVTESSS